MKKIIAVLFLIFSAGAFGADQGLNPQYLNVKIYKFAVSTSEYCINPIVVFENDTPVFENMLTGPTFGSGNLKNGLYKCVILEMSDTIQFASDANSDSGGCALGVQQPLEICRLRAGDATYGLDGSIRNCVNGEERVTLYLSTASLNVGDNSDPEGRESSFLPPQPGSLRRGIHLGAALRVSGNASRTFVVDGRGKVEDYLENGVRTCEMQAPLFSFR